MNQLTKTLAQSVFDQCFGLKHKESVLVVTDKDKLKEAVLFLSAAKQITDKVEMLEFNTMTENAQEPPAAVAKKMTQADVTLLVTTYSLSHTRARKKASQAGVRMASLPGITQGMIIRTLAIDYQSIAKLSQKIARVLTDGKLVSITSPGGTNLELSIAGRRGIADTGLYIKPGDFGNLPAGEAFTAPLENSVNGVVVFDGAFADIDLDSPIKLEIINGRAVNITGRQAAQQLRNLIKQIGVKAGLIGEFGLGTNPAAKLSPEVLEAEKVYGTCHLALGNNLGFGGTINVPFHSDGIILKPTVTIDGRVILKDNKINL
ncbi:MAG: aminopeptidase [Patescibacteria group bacterium]|nr:aminopeptidase [Patescibacteria group bacterium]MDP4031211.1 aminopeptidase [Candidatus Beckwithbacteria bacterium]MDZ4229168.1 aminopeptidase [Patescibacteria group bacterium]